VAGSADSRLPIGLFDTASEEAEEALFLTYTANLEFFERAVLARTRGLQARATMIADAAMVSSDPMAVRHAGLQYLDARAVCPGGAFHPKLIVIAGAEAATLAVGSGNLTLAGWHANAELWTVLRGDAASVPDTFAPAAALLRGLGASPVVLSPGAEDALERAAAMLDRGISTFSGPRLVSSLTEPIIEQIPSGPVEELVVYAPFHDARLEALRALMERLRPAALTVCVAPDTTVSGPLLEAFVADAGGQLAWTKERPHHHGKLIEWQIGDRRWALTGSPNLSAAALLRTVAEGGNCEVGLISGTDASLQPQGAPTPTRGIASLRGPEPGREPAARALLLAATADGGGTVLHLAAALGEPAALETFDQSEGAFRVMGGKDLAPGETSYTIAPGLAPGTALQLVLKTSQMRTNRVYVTDIARATQRPLRTVGKAMTSPGGLARGEAFDLLLEDIDALKAHLLRMRLIETVPSPDEQPPREHPRTRLAPGRSLEDYLDGIRTVFGESLTDWVLSLPSLPAEEDDQTVLRSAGLLTDAADHADPPEDVRSAEPPVSDVIEGLTELERARLRRFIPRLQQRAVSARPVVRVLAARLVLHSIAAKLWTDPVEVGAACLSAVELLCAPGDEPTAQEQVEAASVGAVLLAMLRAQVERVSVRDEPALRFNRAVALLQPLLEDCSSREIARLAGELEPRLGAVVSAEAVFEVALEATNQERGYGRAIHLLETEHGLIAEEREGAIVFHKELPPRPEYRLILAVSLADQDISPVIVRGHTPRGAVIAVWQAPWLVISHSRPRGQRGELYRLLAGAEPASLVAAAHGEDLGDALPGLRVSTWMPGQPPEGVAASLLALAEHTGGS
jgi:hypothetical protein